MALIMSYKNYVGRVFAPVKCISENSSHDYKHNAYCNAYIPLTTINTTHIAICLHAVRLILLK